MAITAADIKNILSGGAANTDPNASLGGAISASEITSGVLNNLFDDVTGAESLAGDTEYRCFYVQNDHPTLTLRNAVIYISSNTPSGDTNCEIGLGTSAVNGTEQTVADESTAPTGVTFSTADGAANALNIGDIPAGEHKAIWLQRDVTAGASAFNNDNVQITVRGDTEA